MLTPCVLRRPDIDGFVLIERGVLDVIARFRQSLQQAPESGGILLGYRRGSHLHVAEATVPEASDESSRYRFFRSADPHQRAATACWQDSRGIVDYLGEWHTHPELVPTPSMTDIGGWTRICKERNVPMVFLIAGTQEHLWFGMCTKASQFSVIELR